MQIPDFLQQFADPSLNAAATAGIVGFARPAHISIGKNRFTLVNDKGEGEALREFEIEVVVVGANNGLSKLYFDEEYDPTADEHKPPKCYSDNGVGPSVNAMEAQNPTCQGCAMNVWGSDTSNLTGKSIRACRDMKKLVVLFDGVLYQMVVPPASLKNWQKYADSVSKHPNISLNIIRTQVSFDEKVQGVLNFRAMGFASTESPQAPRIAGFTEQGELVNFMTQLKAKGSTMLDTFTGNDDKPRTAAIEGPKPNLKTQAGIASAGAAVKSVAERIVTIPAKEPPVAANGNGEFMGAAPTQKPKKNGAAKQAAPFGMVDAETVSDPELENAIAGAMGFLQE